MADDFYTHTLLSVYIIWKAQLAATIDCAYSKFFSPPEPVQQCLTK